MRAPFGKLAAFVVLAVAIAACDSATEGGPPPAGNLGTVQMTFSGAETAEVNGEAIFYFRNNHQGNPIFYLWLTEGDHLSWRGQVHRGIYFTRTGGTRPEPGTYALFSDNPELGTNILVPNTNLLARGPGSITITTSADGEFAGSFTAPTAVDGSPDAHVDISGTFRARFEPNPR